MRARNSSAEQAGRSVTETARRAQIVRSAIETIAELGYARASFSRIAQRAGLSSTGLISYHFAGKDELMSEVAAEVMAAFRDVVVPRMAAAPNRTAELRAFVQATIAFIGTHRTDLVALFDVAANVRDDQGRPLDAVVGERDVAMLAEFLAEGQRAGEFRAFDPQVLAVAIMSLRNGVLRALATDPDLDLELYERELVTMVELATAKEQPR